MAATYADFEALSPEEKKKRFDEMTSSLASNEPGIEGEDDNFKIGQFEALLNRLEGSKKRQQRQRSVEGRRDIFAQGLAGMMGNF
tara:strand:+ start:5523 stop:5777 length:255 start_codon:yes stop_codon:yes gene_type:complete